MDYCHQQAITQRPVNPPLDFNFIDNRGNVVFIGPPGVANTQLALGIGPKAVDAGYKGLFNTATRLAETLELAEIRAGLRKKINPISKFDGLIINELVFLPMSKQSRYNLFQLINNLYEYRAIILTTHKHPDHPQGFHRMERLLSR